MRDFFRALVIIILAALASAGVVIALVFITQRITVQSLTPAHFVPSAEVVAYINNPTEELESYLEMWIPSFTTAIDPDSEAVVLTSIDEEIASIQFVRDSASRTGPFKALASSSGAMALVAESPHSLQNQNDYITLLSEIPAQTPWMFIRLDAIEDSFLRAFQEKGYTALGIWMTDSEIHLHLSGPVDHSSIGITPLLPIPKDGIISIRAANGKVAWEEAIQNLDATEGIVTNQLLQRRINTFFGPQIDFKFHILPLFENSGTIHLQKNSSGSMLFALEGRAPKESINRLHDGFAEVLPKTRVVQRIFDERFPSTDVRIDPSMITDTTSNNGGWVIRITGHQVESEKFFSARNGQMFVISNSEQLLQELIMNDKPSVQLPTGSSLKRNSIIAGGMMDMNEGLKVLNTYVPSLDVSMLSPIVSHLSGSIVWSMEHKRGLTSLTLRKE